LENKKPGFRGVNFTLQTVADLIRVVSKQIGPGALSKIFFFFLNILQYSEPDPVVEPTPVGGPFSPTVCAKGLQLADITIIPVDGKAYPPEQVVERISGTNPPVVIALEFAVVLY
jgi:hypothetical protein